MPNIPSMKKDLRRNAKHRLRNRSTCAALKTYIKKARLTVGDGKTEADALVKTAVSQIDKACQRGIIHRNNAARKKSRLMRAVNKARAASA
jgi:small subunit ribosomal protein S20